MLVERKKATVNYPNGWSAVTKWPTNSPTDMASNENLQFYYKSTVKGAA